MSIQYWNITNCCNNILFLLVSIILLDVKSLEISLQNKKKTQLNMPEEMSSVLNRYKKYVRTSLENKN